MYESIKAKHPQALHDELMQRTRQFVAHPEEISRFAVPPHNSGSAIDLVLAFCGQALDMGTDFDEVSPWSATAAFEEPFQVLRQ